MGTGMVSIVGDGGAKWGCGERGRAVGDVQEEATAPVIRRITLDECACVSCNRLLARTPGFANGPLRAPLAP